MILPITDRVSLFGYSAADAEKYIAKLQADYNLKVSELKNSIAKLQEQTEELKKQFTYEKDPKPAKAVDSDNSKIMLALYDAYMQSSDKIVKAQKDIDDMLSKQKSLITIREKKVRDMKAELQKLIEKIDSFSKNY